MLHKGSERKNGIRDRKVRESFAEPRVATGFRRQINVKRQKRVYLSGLNKKTEEDVFREE